ncbi:hypothetical protein HDU67_007775 [Dinochytrium kinnereticum]|nr:hypothetical protein HDU67_007775 [Dinochytrium kinnereticum]
MGGGLSRSPAGPARRAASGTSRRGQGSSAQWYQRVPVSEQDPFDNDFRPSMDDDDEFLAAEEAAQNLAKANFNSIPSRMQADERARREEEEAYDQARVPVVTDTLISVDDPLLREPSLEDFHVPTASMNSNTAPLSVLNAADDSQLSSFPAISIRPRTISRSAVAAAVASSTRSSAVAAANAFNAPPAPIVAPPIVPAMPHHPLSSPTGGAPVAAVRYQP